MKWAVVFILHHVCMVYCSTISKEDLESFIKFINKTSRSEDNNENTFSKDSNISTVFDWEEGGHFEGDLVLNERQRKMIINGVAGGLSRNGLRDLSKRWPNATVVYQLKKEDFSDSQREAIWQAMNDISSTTCIIFRPRTIQDKSYLRITGHHPYCRTDVGYQGGVQMLNIPNIANVGKRYFTKGVIIHELLHVLGFLHMQSNYNRDKYVAVIWPNIRKGYEHNFRAYTASDVTDFDLAYDYNSIMHNSRFTFSKNRIDYLGTLIAFWIGANIGQRVQMSGTDSLKVNRMYCGQSSISSSSDNENKKDLLINSLISGG